MSMNLYHSNNIGNVAVLGHSGCGKTSIVETMAYRAGAIGQIGNIQSVIQLVTIVLRRLHVSLLLIYQSFRLNGITVRLI